MTSLRLVTFGDLSLVRDDGPRIASTLRKPLTLLAIAVANAPTGTTREQLMLLLWPESSPDRARQALSQSLYALKHELGFAPLCGSAVLELDPRIESDLGAFRTAVDRGDADAAMALARAPFLAGVHVASSPEFDQWVDRVQREVDASLTTCLRDVARRALDAGADDTVRRWQQYAERALLDPPAVREAAAAMAQAGNRAAALTLLARHTEAMERELELGPDATTVALAERLRRAPCDSPPFGVRALPHIEPRPWASPPTGVVANTDGAPTTSAEAAAITPRTPPRPSPRSSPRVRIAFAVAAVGAAALVASSFVMLARRPSATADVSRVLVAPFRFSGDTAYRYLATGIADEIAARLVLLSGVTLYPPSLVPDASVGTPLPVARRLGADYVLDGSIRTESRGGRTEVAVVSRLVAADGHVMWSWSANRQLDGVLALQMAIADSAARRLSVTLGAAALRQLTTSPTDDPEAFDLYLRALEYLRSGRDRLPEARDVLRKAVALDSGFAQALARLGETQARMNWFAYDRDSVRMREALRLIRASRALAPDRSEPHLAMAHWLLADRRAYREASAELDTALILGHANVDVLMTRANVLRRTGRWTEAVADYAEALRLDPTSYAVAIEYGNTLLLMRRFADARVALERARTLSPDAVDPVVWLAALAVRESGDTARARRILDDGAELVDAHRLAARALQSFPEVVRPFRDPSFMRVTEFSLRDAYGDTALLHSMRGYRARTAAERGLHFDSAAAITMARLAQEPSAFAAHRSLAGLRLAQGLPLEAIAAARGSLGQMPASRDVYAAMQALAVLAEAEVAAGQLDSAEVHVRQLLAMPSTLTPALLRFDPAWKPIARRFASERR